MRPQGHVWMAGDGPHQRDTYPQAQGFLGAPVVLAGAIGLLLSVAAGGLAIAVGGKTPATPSWPGRYFVAAAALFWTFVFLDLMRRKRWAIVIACIGVWISILGCVLALVADRYHFPALETVSTSLGLQFPPSIAVTMLTALTYSPPPPISFALAAPIIVGAHLLPALYLTILMLALKRETGWQRTLFQLIGIYGLYTTTVIGLALTLVPAFNPNQAPPHHPLVHILLALPWAIIFWQTARLRRWACALSTLAAWGVAVTLIWMSVMKGLDAFFDAAMWQFRLMVLYPPSLPVVFLQTAGVWLMSVYAVALTAVLATGWKALGGDSEEVADREESTLAA